MATNIQLEERWEIINNEITKLINILEGVPDSESPVYGTIYSTVYSICQAKESNNDCQELLNRYEGVYNDYLSSKVLPAIQEKQDDDDDVSMLQEFVKRWANHKVMVTKLCRYFNYMDRYYITRMQLPCLKDVGFDCFRKNVYEMMKVKVRDAVMALIGRERQGDEIDRHLVKGVLEVFVEIGNKDGKDSLDYYVNDFETAFLSDTAKYFTGKGLKEIKAQGCLKKEKDRVSHYMHSSTEEKVLKQIQAQLLLPEKVQPDLAKEVQSRLVITN